MWFIVDDLKLSYFVMFDIFKPPLASICSSVCLCVFVCLSVAKMQKNAIFSKNKQFRAMVSIDDL